MKNVTGALSPKALSLFTYLGAPVTAAFVYTALAIAWRQPGDEAYLLTAVPMMLEHALLSLTLTTGGGLLYDAAIKREGASPGNKNNFR